MMQIKRDKEDIEAQHSEALVWTADGATQFPAMSYEDGVAAALGWILGETDDGPMD